MTGRMPNSFFCLIPMFYFMQDGSTTVASLRLLTYSTDLLAYSDNGYSDIPATVTDCWSMKESPYTENPGYSDIPLTVTPVTVTFRLQ